MTAENPEASYRVNIKIGDGVDAPQVNYTVDTDDTFNPVDPEQVLDGLTIGWSFPSGAPWPSQPDPSFCTLQLLALDAATLAATCVQGAPVAIEIEDAPGGGGSPVVTFYGRITLPTATPVNRPSGPRTLFTLPCVDYSVDLAELVIALGDRPAEAVGERLQAISDAMEAVGGLPLVPTIIGGDELAASSAKSTDALSAITDVLRQYNNAGGVGYFRRLYLRPRVFGGGGSVVPTNPNLGSYENEIDAVDLPGLLAVDGGILGLTFPASIGGDTPGGVVDGDRVPFDTLTWRNGKRQAVSRVTITGPFGTYQVEQNTTRVVKLELSATLTGADLGTSNSGVERMANMYMPDPLEAHGWEAQTFRFMAGDMLDQLRPMFPDHSIGDVFSQWPMAPVVVTKVPDVINLSGPSGVYAGLLQGAKITLAGRRVSVEFSLRYRLPDPLGNQSKTASYDYVEATFPTIDYDHVDPALTYYNATLARKA